MDHETIPYRSRHDWFSARLQTDHRAQKKDQHADGHERERRAREKFRDAIETLAASGLHERDQGQNETDAVTTERDRRGGRWRPPGCGRGKRTGQFTESKK